MRLDEFSKLLESNYEQLGLYRYDFVYIYSDLRGFASQLTEEVSRDQLFRAVVASLLANEVTVLVPTFTYTTSGTFEVTETQTRLGAMNKWFLVQEGVRRSEHPLFSDAALGPQADLVENVGKSAFGSQSVFGRLSNRRCGFLHLGHDLSKHGNTVIHHVEQVCGATYRLHKAFETKVYRRGGYVGTDYTAFLRRRDVPGHDFVTDFESAASVMRNKGILREMGDAESQRYIAAYGYDESVDLMSALLYQDPSFFIAKGFIQY